MRDDIQDVSNHGFKARGCTGCQPGTCGGGCSSCVSPSCGRSGPKIDVSLSGKTSPNVSDRPFGLPPEKRRRRKTDLGLSEDQIHRAVVEHLRRRAKPGVVWFHVPNGGQRNAREGKHFKDLGVRPGVPDLILVHNGNVYAIELKSSTGRPTVAQMQFMSEFNAAGGNGVICHDLDRALRCLEVWGLLK